MASIKKLHWLKASVVATGFMLGSYQLHGVANLEVFSDPEFINTARFIQNSTSLLEEAKKEEPSSETINARKTLLLKFAHTKYLDDLIGTFPDGLETIVSLCTQDQSFFINLIKATTRNLLPSTVFNDFSLPSHSFFNFAVFDDKKKTDYTPYPQAGFFVWSRSCFNRQTVIQEYPQSLFLLQLLDTPVHPVSVKGSKKNKDELKYYNELAYLAPLLLGDLKVALTFYPIEEIEQDYKKIVPLQGRAYHHVFDNVSLRLAYVTAYKSVEFLGNKQDEDKAMEEFFAHLNKAMKNGNQKERAYAELLRAEYLLRIIFPSRQTSHAQEEINEGLKLLKKLKADSHMDYLAYMRHLDFLLKNDSTTNPQKKVFAERFLKESQRTQITEPFERRLIELSLGFFGGDLDVSSILDLLLKHPNCQELRYRLYMGSFGAPYKDEEKALQILDDNQNLKFFKFQKAIRFLKEKNFQEALNLLNQEPSSLFSIYWRGRLLLDPRSGFTNIKKGIPLLAEAAQWNYRDSQARLVKFYQTTPGPLNQRLSQQVLTEAQATGTWDQESLLRMVEKHDKDKAQAAPQLSPVDTSDSRGSEAEEQIHLLDESLEPQKSFDAKPAEDEEEGEEDELLLTRSDSIDNDEPVTLLDPIIEELMEKLRHQWTWSQLTPYIVALGGQFNGTEITFPNVQGVFNFHRPHAGSTTFFLTKGYYRYLKRMIQERYNWLLKEENIPPNRT